MPILKGSKEVFIIYKNEKIPASIIYETEKKIGLAIEGENPLIKKIKLENKLEFETKQGNYDCYFQSKVDYFDFDMIHNRYILEIDYPAIFRRVLNLSQVAK